MQLITVDGYLLHQLQGICNTQKYLPLHSKFVQILILLFLFLNSVTSLFTRMIWNPNFYSHKILSFYFLYYLCNLCILHFIAGKMVCDRNVSVSLLNQPICLAMEQPESLLLLHNQILLTQTTCSYPHQKAQKHPLKMMIHCQLSIHRMTSIQVVPLRRK